MTWTPSDALVEKVARELWTFWDTSPNKRGWDGPLMGIERKSFHDAARAALLACRDDLVAEAVRAEADLYRTFHDAWVENEVAGATGDPDFAAEKRRALVSVHHAIRARHP